MRLKINPFKFMQRNTVYTTCILEQKVIKDETD